MKSRLVFKDGYKYQTLEFILINVGYYPKQDIISDYITIHRDGIMYIKPGYAWDGPSGVTIDTPNTMFPSIIHDAAYQLMQEGLLPLSSRKHWDVLFKDLLKVYGMSWPRLYFYYYGVRIGGLFFANKPKKARIIDGKI